MAGMDHVAVKQDTTEVPAFASQHQECRVHMCVQQPVVLDDQRAAFIHLTASPGLVALGSPYFVSEPTLGEVSVRGPPPFRLGTPVSLRTTLLI